MRKMSYVVILVTVLTVAFVMCALAYENLGETAGILIEEMHSAVIQDDGGSAICAFKKCVDRISQNYDDLLFYSDAGTAETDSGITQWSALKVDSVSFAVAQSPEEAAYTVGVENINKGYTYSYTVSVKETGECAEHAALHYLDGTVIRLDGISIVF